MSPIWYPCHNVKAEVTRHKNVSRAEIRRRPQQQQQQAGGSIW